MSTRKRRLELARELQAEKEQLEGWEVVQARPAREPTLTFSLRLKPTDIDKLQRHAAAKGVSVSKVIREAIQRYFEQTQQPPTSFTIRRVGSYAERPDAYTTAATKKKLPPGWEELQTVPTVA